MEEGHKAEGITERRRAKLPEAPLRTRQAATAAGVMVPGAQAGLLLGVTCFVELVDFDFSEGRK